MDNSFSLVVGNKILPMDIHAVAADASGHLLEVTWDNPAHFRFSHQGWDIDAYLTEGPTIRLDLTADLGPLPFTAEARAERAGLQAIVDSAGAHLGRILVITPDRRIRLMIGGIVDRPLTTVSLIAGVARLLAPITPYLELLAVFLCPSGGRGPAWRRGRNRWGGRV